MNLTFILKNGTVLPLAYPLTIADLEEMSTDESNEILERIAARIHRRNEK